MPIGLDKFIKQLEESGILANEMIEKFIPPNASPKDAQDLARDLVRSKKLTKFQAEEVYRGNARSLVLGNYFLLEKIGAGGMGQVFKAEHRRMKRIVAVKVLPKGLWSFDANDADFFLDLLPGVRNRGGLPESIAFWKQRIEQTDPEQTFSVGLIYGPSGCGKSSLVKAGLRTGVSLRRPIYLPVPFEPRCEPSAVRASEVPGALKSISR